MRDVLIILGILLALYIFYKMMVKEPILPWMEVKEKPLKAVSYTHLTLPTNREV